MPPIGFNVRRYEDIGIYYDSDIGFTVPLRQRTYKSENGEIQTPVTALLLVRKVPTDCKIPVSRDFTPRVAIACFENPNNLTGESRLKVMIAYRSRDINHNLQIQEVINFPNVKAVEYSGEIHTSSIKRYYD
jgi:hypothetical protein